MPLARPVSIPVPGRDVLASVALLEGLTADQLETVRGHLRCSMYPADTNVVRAEYPGEALFFILQGTVKVQVDQADGSEVILAVLGAGESIGEMSVSDRLDRSANVVTLDETTLAWMDRATFAGYQELFPVLITNVARILSRRLRLANAQILALATQDAYARIARQLLSLAEAYGSDDDGGTLIPLRLTQSELASMVGTSRVRVNQALGFFRDEGYISIDQLNRITVRHASALAARCS